MRRIKPLEKDVACGFRHRTSRRRHRSGGLIDEDPGQQLRNRGRLGPDALKPRGIELETGRRRHLLFRDSDSRLRLGGGNRDGLIDCDRAAVQRGIDVLDREAERLVKLLEELDFLRCCVAIREHGRHLPT